MWVGGEGREKRREAWSNLNTNQKKGNLGIESPKGSGMEASITSGEEVLGRGLQIRKHQKSKRQSEPQSPIFTQPGKLLPPHLAKGMVRCRVSRLESTWHCLAWWWSGTGYGHLMCPLGAEARSRLSSTTTQSPEC